MIDWTKAIETVPDERNPEPVPCEFNCFYDGHEGADVYIVGNWFAENGDNQGGKYTAWSFDSEGNPHYPRLPFIRNAEA